MFYGLFHTGHFIWVQNHFGLKLNVASLMSRSFILALGVHSKFGNSRADYITMCLVGQGFLLRLYGRVDVFLVTLL